MTPRQRGEVRRIEARRGPVKVRQLRAGDVEIELTRYRSHDLVEVGDARNARTIVRPIGAPRLVLGLDGKVKQVQGTIENPLGHFDPAKDRDVAPASAERARIAASGRIAPRAAAA